MLRAGKEDAERRLQLLDNENKLLVSRVRVLEEIEAKYFFKGSESKENLSRRASSNEMGVGFISDRTKSILKNQIIQYDPHIPILQTFNPTQPSSKSSARHDETFIRYCCQEKKRSKSRKSKSRTP